MIAEIWNVDLKPNAPSLLTDDGMCQNRGVSLDSHDGRLRLESARRAAPQSTCQEPEVGAGMPGARCDWFRLQICREARYLRAIWHDRLAVS